MAIYRTETACRACGGGTLQNVVGFGRTPLADRLLSAAELAQPEARVPLTLVFCPACSLVQIAETVEPEVLFGGDYPYFSSVSATLLAHSRANAEELIERQQLGPRSLVVEIASNDGYLLKNFVARGIPVKSLMAELFAKRTGCCHGKGGSMHMGDAEMGMLPAIAIVGGGIPLATGYALSFKYLKKPNIAACFFGDGAVNEGIFHETVNMAAIWDLPVLFICENNKYGASTSIESVMKLKS